MISNHFQYRRVNNRGNALIITRQETLDNSNSLGKRYSKVITHESSFNGKILHYWISPSRLGIYNERYIRSLIKTLHCY